jgi:hypothetical protein
MAITEMVHDLLWGVCDQHEADPVQGAVGMDEVTEKLWPEGGEFAHRLARQASLLQQLHQLMGLEKRAVLIDCGAQLVYRCRPG